MARIVKRGGPGRDSLTSPDDLSGDRYFLAGLGGADTLDGLGSGNDTLVGGKGKDILWTGRGSDRAIGGEGADRIAIEATSSNGLDSASGGSGRDRIDLTLGLGDIFATDDARSFDSIDGGGGVDLLTLREDSTEFTFHARGTQGWRVDLEKQRIFDPVLGYDVAQIKRIEAVSATSNDDTLKGWIHDEYLYGNHGNDVILGGEGDDTLVGGGLGHDTLKGGAGKDFLVGGFDLDPSPTAFLSESDFISPDILRGGKDTDWLVAMGASTLHGDGGNDTLYIAPFQDLGKRAQLFGGPGNDLLAFGAFDNEGKVLGSYNRVQDTNLDGVTLDGGRGIDTADFSTVFNSNGVLRVLEVDLALDSAKLTGGVTNVTLTRIENVRGSNYWDKIDGDNDRNVLEGNGGNDTLRGFGGGDVISGGAGEDSIEGGARDDTLFGGSEVDVIKGGGGDDEIKGGGGSDRLFGGPGNDTIHGGGDSDTINLGAFERGGRQEATGGKGEDTFVLNRDIGVVTIPDFDAKGRLHDFLDLRPMRGVTMEMLDILPYDEGPGVGIFLEGTSLAIDLPGVALRHLDVDDFLI